MEVMEWEIKLLKEAKPWQRGMLRDNIYRYISQVLEISACFGRVLDLEISMGLKKAEEREEAICTFVETLYELIGHRVPLEDLLKACREGSSLGITIPKLPI